LHLSMAPHGTSISKGSSLMVSSRSVLPPYKDEWTTKFESIKNAIPKHCFEHSYLTSFRYLFVDLAVSAALFYAVSVLEQQSLHPALSAFLYAVYWVCQGCILTGVWVIAHECGHGGFSPSDLVNDIVGSICHSFLLVPYWSWKFSHAKHHSKTGHMQGDEVFVPNQKKSSSGGGFFFENPVGVAIQIFTMLTIGWPLYLFTNVTGQSYKNADGSPQWVSHFHPNLLFRSSYHGVSQSAFVLLSDAGLLVMVALLACFCNQFGFLCMMRVYGVPYLIVNFWLVLITELQHTDTRLPHYSGKEWNYLRGALATVDRDYGILNSVFHHIGDTHVCHHLFYYLPHYHAQEATEYIKRELGDFYLSDNTPIAVALWRSFRNCQYVDNCVDSDGKPLDAVLWYKSWSSPKSH